MTSRKYIQSLRLSLNGISIVVLLGSIACTQIEQNTKAVQAQVGGERIAQGQNKSLLSKIRKESHQRYQDAKALEKRRMTEKALSVDEKCVLCDIKFLSEISRKKELNRDQHQYLLCTLDESCVNNAEFQEFYNEQLFRYVSSQPMLFLESLEGTRDKINLLAFHLTHPVSDRYSTDKVVSTFNQIDEKYRGKFKATSELRSLMKR